MRVGELLPQPQIAGYPFDDVGIVNESDDFHVTSALRTTIGTNSQLPACAGTGFFDGLSPVTPGV